MSKPTTHKVVSGDTLSALAKKYGTTVKELKDINGLKSDLIKVGQVLKLLRTTQSTNNSNQPITLSPNTSAIPRSRDLTKEEIALAKSIFGDKIQYDKVKVFGVDYLPNQEENTIVTPNGHIYPARKVYRHNYALDSDDMKKLFIHEMGHIWQNHTGRWVKTEAIITHTCAYFNDTDPYEYNIHQQFGTKVVKMTGVNGKTVSNIVTIVSKLSDYNLEAQAEIFADYWALKIKRNPSLMRDKNFETNIRARNLDDVIRIYERKVKEVIGS